MFGVSQKSVVVSTLNNYLLHSLKSTKLITEFMFINVVFLITNILCILILLRTFTC